MRTRHKPPTLVSMWMLDVFCCALGCVTLLWLLNTREARENADRAGSALELLDRTESDLKARAAELLSTRADLDQTRRKLNADIDDLQGKLVAMTADRDDAAKKLALTRGDLTAAEAKVAASAARSQELDDLLARKKKDATDLAAKLSVAVTASDDLVKLLRQRERERDEMTAKAKAADAQLADLDAKLRAVQKDAAAMKSSGDDLAAARGTVKDLQKKIDDANATIIDLQGQKAKLADKFDKLRVDSDNKFAGIAMTGKRVVFVVDTSGSMKLIDDKTPAPEKWPTVVETVAKVMRTLPDLEQYQVVTFSRKAQYLIGKGDWLPYTGAPTVKKVSDALLAVNPDGDTNLYDALDLAFRLRASGLDTVYLFSDGLPTSGPGVTPEQEKGMTDTQRVEALSRHLRKTLKTDWNRPAAGGRVKINAVGFFFESPEVGAFLWALSRENDGSFVGMSRP